MIPDEPEWRQDEKYLLLYVMPRLFHIVPKAVQAQGVDVNRLAERLASSVGPAS